jgi:hypothetical protein
MSFSQNVKDELLEHIAAEQSAGKGGTARHCSIASLCAIINICGDFSLAEGETYLIISSENERVISLANALINRLYGFECESVQLDGAAGIMLLGSNAGEVLHTEGFNQAYSEGIEDEEPINPLVVASSCCRRAYLRTAFICCGSVTDPDKTYHLELVNSDYYHALALKTLMAGFGVEAKLIERKNHYVVYLKEGEQIVDMLNLISAHRALMEYENKRIYKEVRNNINRQVNCETANLNKVISASLVQREAIEYIRDNVGFSYLSKQLEDVARARLAYPDLSLKELGEKLNPPVGKSGVNHRLKKICTIAQSLKGDLKYD